MDNNQNDNKGTLLEYLEQDRLGELMTIERYTKHLEEANNPYARQVIRHIIQDERDHERSFGDLIRTLPNLKGGWDGKVQTVAKQVGFLLRSNKAQGFALGIGAAALAIMFGPRVKEAVRPAAVGAVRGVMAVARGTQRALGRAKEGLDDLVAEARYGLPEETNYNNGDKEINSPVQEK
ncbi:MAG: ferritin-like domain-containing protein [Clostridia bacterium]|nr:ferritin-like domain-containing protein [Clostridia bacterium]